MQGQYRLSGRKACDVALFRAGQENKRARETGLVFARTLKGCSAAAGCAAGLLLQKPDPRGQLLSLFKIQARPGNFNATGTSRQERKKKGEKETQAVFRCKKKMAPRIGNCCYRTL
jgi:hypothetical protein